ncbi:hypothetical protein [Pseudomonas chlororaphis]|uniref:Uncharacterized protein n=1 Tax=Pseudomonas chlororaphis subsp. aureofaciens TaxID=587851 RepID=A0AAD0ZJ85_9PSED|nr:hypothetical protein [Pseudomonas chlororaphis]AZE30144.1 hypothetical protein C4K07_3359 [Pseudomonas chlororaphis subsp. aureofaciens]
MQPIRTTNHINWESFLDQDHKKSDFILDFSIDAGFSFSTALIFRKFEKTRHHPKPIEANSVTHLSKRKFHFANLISAEGLIIKSINIQQFDPFSYTTTDPYHIEAYFQIPDIDNSKLKGIIARKAQKNKAQETGAATAFLVEYFSKLCESLKDQIIMFIELSGYYAKFKPSTINLYITQNKQTLRIIQSGSNCNTAGQHPLHPGQLTNKTIQKIYEYQTGIPDDLRKLYQKGVHYKFLEFHEESLLCFYKIIEDTFKTESFTKKLSHTLFEVDDPKVASSIRGSSQRTVMIFIYQYLEKNSRKNITKEKPPEIELLLDLIKISNLRNDVAHGVKKVNIDAHSLQLAQEMALFMMDTLTNKS